MLAFPRIAVISVDQSSGPPEENQNNVIKTIADTDNAHNQSIGGSATNQDGLAIATVDGKILAVFNGKSFVVLTSDLKGTASNKEDCASAEKDGDIITSCAWCAMYGEEICIVTALHLI